RAIMDAVAAGSGRLMNGFTYMAHPLACAAALAVQRTVAQEGLLANVVEMGALLAGSLTARFGDHPHVSDIRGRGLLMAIELAAEDGTPFLPELAVAERIKQAALRLGLACYPGSGTIDGVRGDHILLAPPYIAQASDIAAIVDRLGASVDSVCRDLMPRTA
ncbi:MAG: aminotransferase class III-fold pyridoxal phosphate-dependent enzyme, partial [Sphingomonadales bacterium]|nr:aminotransferase class III-fold pyridoxal phosphate-dependent enzyme [Sphingomonadales bacterium]